MSSAAQDVEPISYRKEIYLRLRRTIWEQRFLLCSISLGQFLALCVCSTGVTSELLESRHDITVPTAQAFLNYILLALTFGVYLATKKKFLVILKYNWWKYIVLGVVDVEANYLFILAYKYTNLTSIQLLDCFTIAGVMVLSYVFLKTRYKLINIMGVLLTVIGIAALVLADLERAQDSGGSNRLVGDMLCLVGAGLYAALNVTQEYLVKSHSIVEYLGLIGIVGSFVSGAQLIGLERTNIARIQWTPAIGGLFSGFGFSIFLFYTITPLVIRMSSAVVFNLSLLTADFYSLLFGIYLFQYKFSGFYVLGFLLVVLGIFIYSLKPPVEKKLRERTIQERRKRSIDRRYSVAPTKVDSDEDTEPSRWEIRGLLESSTETTISVSPGKKPVYGSTEMRMPGANGKEDFLSVSQSPAHHSTNFLHPGRTAAPGGKHRHSNRNGRDNAEEGRGRVRDERRKEEEEEERGMYTRVVALNIGNGDSVKFSQSAPVPTIVVQRPSFSGRGEAERDGRSGEGRGVEEDGEERRVVMAEVEEERKLGANEDEEGGMEERGALIENKQRTRLKQRSKVNRRSGSQSSNSRDGRSSLSPEAEERPVGRRRRRRHRSSSVLELSGGGGGGGEKVKEEEEELIERRKEELRGGGREEEEEGTASSRASSHRGSGGSGVGSDPLELLPCERILFHHFSAGEGGEKEEDKVPRGQGGGSNDEEERVRKEEGGRENS